MHSLQNLAKKNFIEEYQLRRTFLEKAFLADFYLTTTLLLKSCPIFEELSPDGDPKFGNFI